MKTISEFEKNLVMMMIDDGLTMSQAIAESFKQAKLKDVYDQIEFLETSLDFDMVKVGEFMKIYLHQSPDVQIMPSKQT